MNVITDLGSGEMAVRMTNSRFARQPLPSIFTGWTTLRVALYLKIGDSGASITGTPRFGVGLCAGNTNILGDTTTDHFCGLITVSTSWSRETGALRYTLGTNGLAPAKQVGATLTTGVVFATNAGFHVTAPSMFFIDITKGSPDYSLRAFTLINSLAAPTPTLADFLLQSVSTVPAFTNHLFHLAQTVAVDETVDGTLDHACVWWNQAVTYMDILAWRVYRLA